MNRHGRGSARSKQDAVWRAAPDISDAEHELEDAVAARDCRALTDKDRAAAEAGVRELGENDTEGERVEDHAKDILDQQDDRRDVAVARGAHAKADRRLHRCVAARSRAIAHVSECPLCFGRQLLT
jgi:DNA-binding helix-hairpin-helix protein with protein kinase domain